MLKRIIKYASLFYLISVITLFLTFNFSAVKDFFLGRYQNKIFDKEIQIWSKAAIGEYLWRHLFNGTILDINRGFYQTGNKTINDIEFNYFSGPGYIQTTLPQNVKYLILILNGRTFEHSIKVRHWLDYLPRLHSLDKVAIILLGNENCEDEWIVRYLKSRGGIIDVLFIVYDSPLVDNAEVFQWPLGVATYRGFPNIEPSLYLQSSPRKYLCNFLGTVYKNSSRQTLVDLMAGSYLRHKCFIQPRKEWLPEETNSTLNIYIQALKESVLTLSPAGKNAECYRLYEAMSLGSIPIIVNNDGPQGKCVKPSLRLLSQYKAPILRFSSWKEAIHTLTTTYLDLPHSHEMLHWYNSFKKRFTMSFVEIINRKFFPISWNYIFNRSS